MYLHIGRDVTLRQQNIVAIFDIESASVSKWTREFLALAEKDGRVVNVTDELPKSFIVCRGEGKEKAGSKSPGRVYISQISSTTLLRRFNFFREFGTVPD